MKDGDTDICDCWETHGRLFHDDFKYTFWAAKGERWESCLNILVRVTAHFSQYIHFSNGIHPVITPLSLPLFFLQFY